MVQGATAEEQVMISDVLPTGFECGVLNGRVRLLIRLYAPSQIRDLGVPGKLTCYRWWWSRWSWRNAHLAVILSFSYHHDRP